MKKKKTYADSLRPISMWTALTLNCTEVWMWVCVLSLQGEPALHPARISSTDNIWMYVGLQNTFHSTWWMMAFGWVHCLFWICLLLGHMLLCCGANGFLWIQFINCPFDVSFWSCNRPECYWRRRGDVKDSLGLNPGQTAREGRWGDEKEKVEERKREV